MASNATAGHNCPSPMKATSSGLFQGDSPLDYALPLAILQICLVVALTRGLAVLLRLLRQPRVVAEIIVLNDQTFAIMVLMALFTTFITTPVVMALYKPARRKTDYKYRTIERKNPNTQLRILACFHGARNIPSMINLFEASRGVAKLGGLSVYALHLMELSERSSAILMAHKARKNGLPFWNKGLRSDSDHVVVAFEAFQQLMEPETIGEISTIDMQENSGIKTSLSAEEFLSQNRRIQKNDSVRYEEKAVRNVTETIAAIRGAGHCNLFLVGRMPEGELALALRRRSECPELGPVGSLLTSPDFSMTASVLVIQQYNGYMSLNLASDMEEESPGKDSESS
ncbi:hypothetical protein V6N13_124041 [Hibiscus sabdariffa]